MQLQPLLSRHFSLHVQYICSTCVWSTLVILNAPDSARTTCTNQTLSDQTYTRPHLVFPPRTSTLKKVFAWAPKSRGAPANSATHVASWLILGSYLYSVITSHDFNSISATLHFLWSKHPGDFQPAQNGMLQMMRKDLPDDFETSRNSLGGLMKDVFPFHLGFSMLKGLVLYNNGP